MSGEPAVRGDFSYGALDKFQDTQRIVAETEQIGQGVVTQMEGQREQLLASHQQVQEISGFADDAKEVMGKMRKRLMTQKGILALVIIILTVVDCVVFYNKFLK